MPGVQEAAEDHYQEGPMRIATDGLRIATDDQGAYMYTELVPITRILKGETLLFTLYHERFPLRACCVHSARVRE